MRQRRVKMSKLQTKRARFKRYCALCVMIFKSMSENEVNNRTICQKMKVKKIGLSYASKSNTNGGSSL
jgi:hypothetical protein